MPKAASIEQVVENIYQSVLATPKRQRRLLSKTFWDMFGFKVRSRQRIEQVRTALNQRHLLTNLSADLFGAEAKDNWLIVTYDDRSKILAEAVPDLRNLQEMPSDAWFTRIENGSFQSEKEVEHFFIQPLVEELGYAANACSIDYSLPTHQGSRKTMVRADFVLFDGEGKDREHALVVIEAKGPGRRLTADDAGQARSYAFELSVPYYAITNGDEIRLYQFNGGVQPDPLLDTFYRAELRSRWVELSRRLHRTSVVAFREIRRRQTNEYPAQE
ncbi:MAG TPA: type I restriction enzyme HsdR N-terminal domain-containing protein [Chloroflexia bacterium]